MDGSNSLSRSRNKRDNSQSVFCLFASVLLPVTIFQYGRIIIFLQYRPALVMGIFQCVHTLNAPPYRCNKERIPTTGGQQKEKSKALISCLYCRSHSCPICSFTNSECSCRFLALLLPHHLDTTVYLIHLR